MAPNITDISFHTTCTANYVPVFQQMKSSFIETFGTQMSSHLHVRDVVWPDVLTKTNHNFRSDSWYFILLKSVEHCCHVLRFSPINSFVCFIDCDIQFFPFCNVSETVKRWNQLMKDSGFDEKEGATDALFMSENEKEVNTGFVIVRVCQSTRNLYNKVLRMLRRAKDGATSRKMFPYGDQTAINNLLRTGHYSFKTIDERLAVFGTQMYGHDQLFHHAVIATNTQDKLQLLEDIRVKVMMHRQGICHLRSWDAYFGPRVAPLDSAPVPVPLKDAVMPDVPMPMPVPNTLG